VPIPKVFHRIWLKGSPPMPQQFVDWGRSWLYYNRDWEMKTWTTWPEWGVNKEEFDTAQNFVAASDVLRYEILYHEGGVYIDTDFECLKPIGALIEPCDAFTAYEGPGVETASCAITGAVPNHPAFKSLVECLPQSVKLWYGPSAERMKDYPYGYVLYQVAMTGPRFFTRVLSIHPEVHIFDSTLFYPLPYADKFDWRPEKYPDAYAVHHWAATWIPEESLI